MCSNPGLEDAVAVLVLPQRYRRRLRTTNMCERLNEELRRRERVIRIFPNEASAIPDAWCLACRAARDLAFRSAIL